MKTSPSSVPLVLVALASVASFAGAASTLEAQRVATPDLVGQRVRLTVEGEDTPLVGVVEAHGPGVLELDGTPSDPRALPLEAIERVEVSYGMVRSTGRGLAVGAGFGAFTMGAYGIAVADVLYESEVKGFFVGAALGAAIGLPVGAILGSLFEHERWEDVTMGAPDGVGVRLHVAPMSAGRVAIGLAVSF